MAQMNSLENELHALLLRLCGEWGFCLPWEEHKKIMQSERLEAREFALKVLRAEGFDPPEYEPKWIRKISARFKEHFGQSVVTASDYPPEIEL